MISSLIQDLFALQRAHDSGVTATAGGQSPYDQLRTRVPEPVLTHFDRLVSHGRKGIAVVRGGVCGGCHIRVPVGTELILARAQDLRLCENCGAYLMLDPENTPAAPVPAQPPPPAKPKPRRARRQLLPA
jgi:hypothetical protein